LYAPLHGGRAKLIAARLPSVSAKPVPIGGVVPDAPLGSWTLLEPDLMLAAGDCSSPFPNGEARLVEDRGGPPSRAYLKLYESFVRLRRWPRAGETCLDLGASPGGWTWLLAQTAASVVAVDKAPLADHVGRMSNVRWQQGSAFALDPRREPPVDWLCSDIICYPQRLLGLVAPPSSAKTEILNSVSTLPFVLQAATVTPAALLSGTPKKQHHATAKGGLLRQIGEFGILALKDFGSILSMRPDAKAEVLAALREIYDGAWTRHLGTEGGKTLSWKGKIGLVFGATGVIDSHYSVIGAMGDRFLLCRLAPEAGQFKCAIKHAGAGFFAKRLHISSSK
jgi:hypothetical protein